MSAPESVAADPLVVVSFGGGVQSTALLVLAATGRIPHRTFLFANVGDDSENPATLRYIRDVAQPYADASGLKLVELRRVKRNGEATTLWRELTRAGGRQELLPWRLTNGMPGRRNCTAQFKIDVVRRWLRQHGATAETPARVAIGFSTDEWRRLNNRRSSDCEVVEHPLIDLGLSRDDCGRVIEEAGLPVPPKSACWFCPFHSQAAWDDVAREHPKLVVDAAGLEHLVNLRRQQRGAPPVWLSSYRRPLLDALGTAGSSDDADDGPQQCDSGHCWT